MTNTHLLLVVYQDLGTDMFVTGVIVCSKVSKVDSDSEVPVVM